jgi:hypothetical protein
MRDIKVITNSPEPKTIPELYSKTKGNISIISSIISAILLKYNREYLYKNPDFIVFL